MARFLSLYIVLVICKLPKSAAIVFSIRTYQVHLEDFKTYPRKEAESLINAIETIHPDFIPYKAMPCWKEASLRYLRENVLGLRTPDTKWRNITLFVGSGITVVGVALLVAWKYRQMVKT